jgi:lysophospholipase L1-like esterase
MKFTVRTILALVMIALLLGGSAAAALSPLTYTALGDSITFGLWAPIGQGYVPLYAQHIQADTGRLVNTYNLGIPGWTSADLANAIRNYFAYRLSVYFSNVVTWYIGGNDLNHARSSYKSKGCGGPDNQQCLRNAVYNFKLNWDTITYEVLRLRGGRPTLLRVATIYNPFVNIDRASDTWPDDAGTDFEVLKPYLDEVNNYIASTASAHGIAVADVYQAFNGASGDMDPGDAGLLAFDHFHPGPAGHAVIANLLRALGYQP